MSTEQLEITTSDQRQNGLAVTPMSMIQLAVERGADINTIEHLVALQEKMLARQAEAEFNTAMNRVQSVMGPVTADLDNQQTRSKYASYRALDARIRPIYSKEGFSLSFDTGDAPVPEMVRVLCYVSHASGHTRTYRVDMPADGKGAKGGDVMTKTHAAGAAMSYGMRYLLKYIFNIAIGEDDNDGNSAKYEHLTERLEWIQNCRNLAELQQVFKAAYAEAFEAKDSNAQKVLVAAKDARKAALR